MKFSLVIFLLIGFHLSNATQAKTRNLDDIVRVVGTPRPEFTVTLSKEELKQLAESIGQLVPPTQTEIDINDLYKPGDEQAIAQAASGFAASILAAAKEVVNLKAIVFRLSALSSIPDVDNYRASLNKAYKDKLQNSFNKTIGELSKFSAADAIKACASELCVATIANAQLELFNFAEGLNQGFDLDYLRGWSFKFQFQNRFLLGVTQASLNTVWNSLDYANEENHAFGTLVAGVLSPLALAGGAVVDIAGVWAGLIAAPTVIRYEVSVTKAPISFDRYRAQVNELVARKIYSIVNGNKLSDETPNSARLIALTCSRSETNEYRDPPSGSHILLAGILKLDCTYSGATRDWSYDVEIFGIGPGAQYKWSEGALITIISITKRDPSGTWYGVQADAALVVGANLGIFAGDGASLAVLTGVDLGVGAEISGARLVIKRR